MNAKLKNGSGRSFSDVKFVLFINWFWTINFSIWALAKELLPKLTLILKSKSRRWTLQLWAIKIQSSNKFLDSATISSQKFIVITCWKWKLGIWAQRSPTAICKLQFHIYICIYLSGFQYFWEICSSWHIHIFNRYCSSSQNFFLRREKILREFRRWCLFKIALLWPASILLATDLAWQYGIFS